MFPEEFQSYQTQPPLPLLHYREAPKFFAWPACQFSERGMHWVGQGSSYELHWEIGKSPRGMGLCQEILDGSDKKS
eukprot:52068-Pelagomonas_calceolata.AAC.1